MPLFLDRLPLLLRHKRSRAGEEVELWSVALEVTVTEPGAPRPPATTSPQRWIFDTGKDGDAACWRCDLEEAGLNPDLRQLEPVVSRGVSGPPQRLPTRNAALWLWSNIPAVRETPLRLELKRGIAFEDRPDRRSAGSIPPRVGMAAFRRAQLHVCVDLARATVSIWTPGSWRQSCGLFVRRALSGFATIPPPW
jgi:hypothetical protein